VAGWKAARPLISGHVIDTNDLLVIDDRAQQPFAARPVGHGARLVAAHTAIDEAVDVAVPGGAPITDSQRCIARPGQIASGIDDELQHLIDVQLAGDSQRGLVQRGQRSAGKIVVDRQHRFVTHGAHR